jgi:hypothetical protein
VDEIFEDVANPRIHPAITLVGQEWRRAGEAKVAPDFDAFSCDKIARLCKVGAAANPRYPVKLHMANLSNLLWAQNSVHWWLPGEEDEEEDDDDEDEEVPGMSPSPLTCARYVANNFTHYRRISEPTLGAHV